MNSTSDLFTLQSVSLGPTRSWNWARVLQFDDQRTLTEIEGIKEGTIKLSEAQSGQVDLLVFVSEPGAYDLQVQFSPETQNWEHLISAGLNHRRGERTARVAFVGLQHQPQRASLSYRLKWSFASSARAAASSKPSA